MFLNCRIVSLALLLVTLNFNLAFGQQTQKNEAGKKPENVKQKAFDAKTATAEQLVETCILIYGGIGGRESMKQIRKTSAEFGKQILFNADGTSQQINYEKRILRGDTISKERIRLDQEYPSAKFALIYNDSKIFGIYNDRVFVPNEEATRAFSQQIWRGIDALLRYKENGSKLELTERGKAMGVDFAILQLTDTENRVTRFFVSLKTFRVIKLEYADGGTNFVRRFYDYRYAQGTLVPYRTTLFANDRQVEETLVSTITFGQKVDDSIFQAVSG